MKKRVWVVTEVYTEDYIFAHMMMEPCDVKVFLSLENAKAFVLSRRGVFGEDPLRARGRKNQSVHDYWEIVEHHVDRGDVGLGLDDEVWAVMKIERGPEEGLGSEVVKICSSFERAQEYVESVGGVFSEADSESSEEREGQCSSVRWEVVYHEVE